MNYEFIKFHKQQIDLMKNSNQSGTCIGINFKDGNILSIKFYYVFLEKFSFKKPFPIPELQDGYKKLIDKAAKNISDISLPGCGLTFAIKFDFNLNSTKGLFFRINQDNTALIDNVISNYPEINFNKNEFENGYGVFLTTKGNVISESNYIYLSNTDRLKCWEEKFDISFSGAGTVEINNANSKKRNQKFLLIHEKNKISDQFYSKIPKIVREVINNWDINLWSPAVNPTTEIYSIYIFSKPLTYSPENDLIEVFFNRVNK